MTDAMAAKPLDVGAPAGHVQGTPFTPASMSWLIFAFLGGIAAPAPTQSTPSEVVKAFYAACNDGLYSKAEQLATKESIDYMKATFALMGGLRGYCEAVTEEGTLSKVEIHTERVRGEGARVTLTFHYKDGKTEGGQEELLQTPAGWRIQVLGQVK